MQFRNKILNEAKEYLAIAIGLLINAAAWQLFILPQHVTGGGATGISAIILYATGGVIPMWASYLVINAFLLVAAWKIVGSQFTIRTSVGVCLQSLWFAIPMGDIFEKVAGQPFPAFDPFMCVLTAGAIEGFGLALAFTNNGSSGGTDIIAKIINKYKDVTLGRAMIFIDIIIICCSIFAPETTIEGVIYGLIFMVVSYVAMDIYINGIRQSVQFFIYTKKPEEIAEAISAEAHRGVTLLHAEGWYSKSEMQVVTVLVRKHESPHIFRIVKNIDPEAFISQIAAIGVYGRGFDSIAVKK